MSENMHDDAACVPQDIEDYDNPWQVDVDDPTLPLTIASERLSTVRYVFLVQIEDGIASAEQRAALEYADAVLIGWPDADSPEVVSLDDARLAVVREHVMAMEGHVADFAVMEQDGDADGMTDKLIRVTEHVSEIRRAYQPDFALPTFAEIRRVVQDEWQADMERIGIPDDASIVGSAPEYARAQASDGGRG